MEITRVILTVVCLLFVPSAGFAECERQGGCADVAEMSAVASDVAEEAKPAKSGYTWEELVEAIPQLKEYELGFQRSDRKGASKDEGTYMVCQKVKGPDSRIKRRACMPLNEYLAYVTRERTAAEQARLEFLSRPSQRPVTRLQSRCPGC
ncbi:MAG: hypothetical protein AAGA68_07530 [Pseudomonadota bacterium]